VGREFPTLVKRPNNPYCGFCCFHSISFPNEWGGNPAGRLVHNIPYPRSFHSISFPSEWGERGDSYLFIFNQRTRGFHSISFPSEWGVVCLMSAGWPSTRRFHSISFPSEWGDCLMLLTYQHLSVSIQLVSPASGEL
jgi:hypothetical protein